MPKLLLDMNYLLLFVAQMDKKIHENMLFDTLDAFIFLSLTQSNLVLNFLMKAVKNIIHVLKIIILETKNAFKKL